jgi:putative membrane protein
VPEESPDSPNKQQLAKARTDWADDRTDWAHQRTLMANERTFSAWVRTGIAATAAGLGIARLIVSTARPWLPRLAGVILILVGAGTFVIALWRYWQGYEALQEDGVRVTPLWPLIILVGALLVGATLAFLLLFETQ